MDQTLFAMRLQEAMDSKGLKRADLLNLASAQGTKLGKSQSLRSSNNARIKAYRTGSFNAKNNKENRNAGTTEKGSI